MKPVVADYRYRVMCLRIEPKVGPIVRLTNHARDLTMGNGQVYLTNSGYDFTSYSAATSTSPSMVDLEGILGIAGVTRAQLSSGMYDNARCYLYATTWNNPIEDEEEIVLSFLGKVQFIDDRYRVEEMSLTDALNQSVGDTYTTNCPKTFGGQEFAGCKVNLGPLTVTGTITSVTNAYVMADTARAEAADYFGAGLIRFTTGENAGLPQKEIKSFSGGTITIFEPFYYPVAVGDQYEMTPGCRKRQQDCNGKWNNIVNFGGYTHIPVASTYQSVGSN